MEPRTARLTQAMIEYDRGDAPRIQHFIKVHGFASTIARLENLAEPTRRILEAAAILHDIGIHPSEKKYGNDNGKHQEELGPAEAVKLLEANGEFTQAETDRIAFLIGHHHTYEGVEGLDWQILLEADFLVNLYENQLAEHNIKHFRDKVFKTPSGIRLLNHMCDFNRNEQ